MFLPNDALQRFLEGSNDSSDGTIRDLRTLTVPRLRPAMTTPTATAGATKSERAVTRYKPYDPSRYTRAAAKATRGRSNSSSSNSSGDDDGGDEEEEDDDEVEMPQPLPAPPPLPICGTSTPLTRVEQLCCGEGSTSNTTIDKAWSCLASHKLTCLLEDAFGRLDARGPLVVPISQFESVLKNFAKATAKGMALAFCLGPHGDSDAIKTLTLEAPMMLVRDTAASYAVALTIHCDAAVGHFIAAQHLPWLADQIKCTNNVRNTTVTVSTAPGHGHSSITVRTTVVLFGEDKHEDSATNQAPLDGLPPLTLGVAMRSVDGAGALNQPPRAISPENLRFEQYVSAFWVCISKRSHVHVLEPGKSPALVTTTNADDTVVVTWTERFTVTDAEVKFLVECFKCIGVDQIVVRAVSTTSYTHGGAPPGITVAAEGTMVRSAFA